MTTAISETWLALVALFLRRGADAALAIAGALELNVNRRVVATIVISLAGFGAPGTKAMHGVLRQLCEASTT